MENGSSMKLTRLTNFFAIPLENKGLEPNVLSERVETTEVTQKEGANTGMRSIQSANRLKFK
jgi:hypothetical protein